MSDVSIPQIGTEVETAPLTQIQRVLCIFSAPSKAFEDVKRNSSWWLPFLLSVVFSYALFGAITAKITWPQVVENTMKQSPKLAERLDKLTPEQRAGQLKFIAIGYEASFAMSPIVILIVTAVIAAVLLATINFGFGGKANFWQSFAVVFYAGLPGILKSLLGTVAIFAGLDPESFNWKNFAGTNIGYFLPADTSKGLMAIATELDATTIWTLVLASIGISIVAGTKRNAGYIAVFGWWAIGTLISVGLAVAFG